MRHIHQWYVTQYLLLTLPDGEGYADRFTQWRCHGCPLHAEIDAHVQSSVPLATPAYWIDGNPDAQTHTSRGARQWLRTHH